MTKQRYAAADQENLPASGGVFEKVLKLASFKCFSDKKRDNTPGAYGIRAAILLWLDRAFLMKGLRGCIFEAWPIWRRAAHSPGGLNLPVYL
jgi:hypothetical protein